MSNTNMSVSASSHNSEINQNYAKNGRDYFFDQAFYQKKGFIAKPDWSGFDDFQDLEFKGFTPKEYAIEHEMRIIESSTPSEFLGYMRGRISELKKML